jgi:epoxyqueuosine reductase
MAQDYSHTSRLRVAAQRRIEVLVETHPGNRDKEGYRYFDAPLVGFASAADELFIKYKRVIGLFHWTPTEALRQVTGPGGAGAGTVISWVLPITEQARHSNAAQERHASIEWARTRDFGEQFNDVVRGEVVRLITARGGHAVAPMLSDLWARVRDPETGIASNWSERHAAYAAGLGTFSINDGFITQRGIAHRCGSVVTDIVLEPSRCSNINHMGNCLAGRGMECGICIKRCPCGAISLENHDKDKCEGYYEQAFEALKKEYGVSVTGCGLCQTGVPCESSIPENPGPTSNV